MDDGRLKSQLKALDAAMIRKQCNKSDTYTFSNTTKCNGNLTLLFLLFYIQSD